MRRTTKVFTGVALATVTVLPLSLAPPTNADGPRPAATSSVDGTDQARTGAAGDRKGDALGNGFDIRRLVVRNKQHTIRATVAFYKGRARDAYTSVDIDPAPWRKVTYEASISMNRRGQPTGADLVKYRGSEYLGGVPCKKFGAGYHFDKHTKRFTFGFRVPYRCIQQAKKARVRAVTQNNTEYGYDRTRRITVRRG